MITRFAPAPTGYLHLGHVVNAIYVWGLARALGGDVILRIEDHDRVRSRREFDTAILEDLGWLGFTATAAGSGGPVHVVRQSGRSTSYARALDALRQQQLIYACDCSRRDIVAAGGADAGGELRYPGTCAEKGLAFAPGLALRVRLAPSVERFDDGVHGVVEQRPFEQCGDMVVKDRDGNWTYQFAVAVDDWEQQITHVIRGDDLLASTGRQIQLARMLGRDTPPRFLHHPLVMKSPTQKLSKADGDTSVRDLRVAGLTAADVLGRAAHAAGFVSEITALLPVQLMALPRLRSLSRLLA